MHIMCRCGYRIQDSTDYLSYKGHVISDQDMFDFLDLITNAIETNKAGKESLIEEIYRVSVKIDKHIYQCANCGALYLEDNEGNLYFFSAEEGTNKALLESGYGSSWKGFLYADWDDKKTEWREHNGHIYPLVNIELKNRLCYFDDRDEFERAYYVLFEELKNKNVLRCASLKINGKMCHNWESEKN